MQNLYTILLSVAFHSIWQTALLWLCHITITHTVEKSPNKHIIAKNSLFISLLFQCFFSVVTFIWLVYTENESTNSFLFPIDTSPLIPQIFVYIYLILLFYNSFNFIKGWIKFGVIRNSEQQKAPAEWHWFLQQKIKEWGIRKNIAVRLSSNITTPLTYGFLKPVILFPAAYCSGLNMNIIEMILLHELAHIRNKDFVRNILVSFIELIYCYHPLILHMGKQWRLQSEISCDNEVVNQKYTSIQYAEALLTCSKWPNHNLLPASAFLGAEKDLLHRIKTFTGTKTSPLHNSGIHLLLTILLAICLSISIHHPNHHSIDASTSSSVNLLYKKNNPTSNSQDVSKRLLKKNNPVIINTPLPLKEKSEKSNKETFPVGVQQDEQMRNITAPKGLFHWSNDKNTDLEKKQMIIKEEDPASGKTVVKIYRLVQQSGKWTAQLVSVILEQSTTEERSLQ